MLKIKNYTLYLLLIWFSFSESQNINKKYIDSIFLSIKNNFQIKSNEQKVYDLLNKLKRLEAKNAQVLYIYCLEKVPKDEKCRLPLLYSFSINLSIQAKYNLCKQIRKEGLKLATTLNNTYYKFEFNKSLGTVYIDLLKPDSASYYINNAEKITLEYPKKFNQHLWYLNHEKAKISGLLNDKVKQNYFYEQSWEGMKNYKNHSEYGFLLYMLIDYYQNEKNVIKQIKYTNLYSEHLNKKNTLITNSHLPVFSALFEKTNEENIKNLKKVIKVSDSINSYNSFVYSSVALSNIYSKLNEEEKAIYVIKETLKKLNKQNAPMYSKLMIYKNLENKYSKIGDYKNSYLYLDTIVNIQKDLNSKRNQSIISELEVQYKTEKQQQELVKQKTTKNLLLWILGLILLTLSLTTFFVFKFKNQKKLLSKQKKLLEIAIHKKNLLIQETHHRIKNSFQIVSNLLYLQQENVSNSYVYNELKEAQNRVRSLSLIHQKLYNDEKLIGVNTKDYLTDLIKDIYTAYNVDDSKTSLSIDELILDIESITPIGLIVNELITNIIKHAYPKAINNPRIMINFKKNKTYLLLKVIDYGKGFLDFKNENFGIKMIKTLLNGLEGKIHYQKNKNSEGTTVTIEIHDYNLL